jgi:hypothetical protein
MDCFRCGLNVAVTPTLAAVSTTLVADLILTSTVPLDGGTLEDLSSLPEPFFRLRLAAREHDLLKTRFLSVGSVVATVSPAPISSTVTYPLANVLLWLASDDAATKR